MCEIDLFCRREPTHPADESSDVSIEDLDVLFAAVTARLRSIAQPQGGHESVDEARMRADVMECAEAQEKLAATAMHALGRHH